MKLLLPRLITAVRKIAKPPVTGRKKLLLTSLLVAGFTLILGLGFGSWYGALLLREKIPPVMLPPELLIAGTFSMSGILLLISNAVVALSVLYYSRDIERLLGAPISPLRLFSARLGEILLISGWMPFSLLIPILAGFGAAYGVESSFYLLLPLVIFLYFCIPTVVSSLLITFVLAALPPKRSRDLFLGAGLATLAAILLATRELFSTSATVNSFEEMIRTLQVISLSGHWWSLPTWASRSLFFSTWSFSLTSPPLVLLGVVLALGVISYFLLSLLFPRAFDAALSSFHQQSPKRFAKRSFRQLPHGVLREDSLALIMKERLLLFREPAHLFQLLLILGLWGLYLYNLQYLRPFEGINFDLANWWTNLFLMLHFILSHFMCIATVNRFAFTTVSIEREAFWIIDSSPISLTTYLWTKFAFWLTLLGPINAYALGLGASLITKDTTIVIMSASIGFAMAIGIVGLAIGFGIRFSNFSWEHFAEIAASLGSVLFLISALSWLCVCGVPTLLALWMITHRLVFHWSAPLLSLAGLLVMNALMAYISVTLGVRWAEAAEALG